MTYNMTQLAASDTAQELVVYANDATIPALIILAVVIMFVFALYSSFFQRDL